MIQTAAATSTGLAPRTAATLAYAAWWITGLMFWFLEREDRFVRFHAAQAMVGFGAISGLVVGLAVLAGGLAGISARSLHAASDRGVRDLAWRSGALAGGDVESGERRRVPHPARR